MVDRVLIDASYTLASGKSSGIERVVRGILTETAALGREGCLPVPQTVISLNGKFYAVDDQQIAYFSKPAEMHADVLSMTPVVYRKLAQSLCQVSGSQKMRKWFLPQAGHLGIFKLTHTIYEAAVRRRISRSSKPIQFGQGDLLILPDAYWINRLRHSVWPAAAEARAAGSLVATVLYDLIPLTHPEFVGRKRRDAFLDYLKKAATHSDLLLAISKTVRDEAQQYLESMAGPDDTFCQDLRSFELGAELQNVSGSVRSDVRDVFAGDAPPYLMVATFDPRKNHQYLLDAFDQLWNERPHLKLCLVGRIGSRCDEVIQRIAQHPLLNKNLFLFSDLSDAELQHCYRRARGVIFPSVVEGFGLPIVEALWFGKKALVSDTPIHREVGDQDCSYFDLADPRSLVAEVIRWEEELSAGRELNLPTRKPTSWRASTEQLIAHCMQAFMARDQAEDALRKAA